MNYSKRVNEKALILEAKALMEYEMSHFNGRKPKLSLKSNLSGDSLELRFTREDSSNSFNNYFIKLHINTFNSDYIEVKSTITLELDNQIIETLEKHNDTKLKQLLNKYNSINNLSITSKYYITQSVVSSKIFLKIQSTKIYKNTQSIKPDTIKELLYYTKELTNTYLNKNVIL